MRNRRHKTYSHKNEEAGRYYKITKGKGIQYDREMEVKN